MPSLEKYRDDQEPFLSESDCDHVADLSSKASRPYPRRTLLVVIISFLGGFLLAAGLAFGLGLQVQRETSSLGWETIGLKKQQYIFKSNMSFVQRPSNFSDIDKTDPIWLSMYPSHHAFFYYPDEKPMKSTLAGFHQMHCVDTLRRGYYEIYDSRQAIIDGQDPAEVHDLIELHHILHCVEYLRNSIMCVADATMEFTPNATQGIGGYGFVHSCRNWYQMVDWVNDRNVHYDELRRSAEAISAELYGL